MQTLTPQPSLLLDELRALDLANTHAHRNGLDADLLDRPAALGQWLHAEGCAALVTGGSANALNGTTTMAAIATCDSKPW